MIFHILLVFALQLLLSVESSQTNASANNPINANIFKIQNEIVQSPRPSENYLRKLNVKSYDELEEKVDHAVHVEDFDYIQWLHMYGELINRIKPEHVTWIVLSKSEISLEILIFLLYAEKSFINELNFEQLILSTVPDQPEKFALLWKWHRTKTQATLSKIIAAISFCESQDLFDFVLGNFSDLKLFMAALKDSYRTTESEFDERAKNFLLKNLLN